MNNSIANFVQVLFLASLLRYHTYSILSVSDCFLYQLGRRCFRVNALIVVVCGGFVTIICQFFSEQVYIDMD